ncbi:MAG: type II toxin-antitoxin system death-on-curing family toxin [Neomegalonema sp.]|nr:type II toxin-antitoxin system death-on-curing family toxin [Neomegalonema sp.]
MTQEPRWLTQDEIVWVHEEQLRQHGGAAGVRDPSALAASLARPQHKWAYGAAEDVVALAAAYGFAFARNHPFVDGNKRTSLVATELFLALNGWALHATNEELVVQTLALAAGELTEDAFADWLRIHTQQQ